MTVMWTILYDNLKMYINVFYITYGNSKTIVWLYFYYSMIRVTNCK